MIVERFTGIPISSKPAAEPQTEKRPPRGPATAEDAVLLVGHGSHCKISAAQMHTIGDLAAEAMPDRIVEVGFLEMTAPPAGVVLDELVARGAKRVVIIPLMLLAASHSKSDVPAIVVEGRLRHPGVELLFGSPLGISPELVQIGAANLEAVGGAGLPLVVVARGTSDPDANSDAVKLSRLLGEWVQTDFLFNGFTGMTWPLVPDALNQVAAALNGQDWDTGGPGTNQPGQPKRIALFFWFLCNGKLIERARNQIAEFTERTGIEVVDAGYFGPDPLLVDIITRRVAEAIDGQPTVNCDTCAYRAAFPGQEDKVGQPIGIGHSHLAAEHRASGHSHDHDHSHDHGHSH